MHRQLQRIGPFSLLFCLLFLMSLRNVQAAPAASEVPHYTGVHDEPIIVQLTAPPNPTLGQPQTLNLSITPRIDAPDLRLRWEVPPGVTLIDAPAKESLGARTVGETITLTRQLRIDQPGLHRVGVEASFEPTPAERYGGAAILFFTVDAQGGSVSEIDPQQVVELEARIPLGADAKVMAAEQVGAAQADASSTCVDVIGRVTRIDRLLSASGSIAATDVVIPVTSVHIELWESDLIFDDHEGTTTPNANGEFIFRTCTNDGFFDDTLEFYIKVAAVTRSSIAEVRYFKPGPNNTTWVLIHEFDSEEIDISDPGTVDFGTLQLNETASAAINIAEAIYQAWVFWNEHDGDPNRNRDDDVVVYWIPGRKIGSGSHYEPIGNDIYINGGAGDPDEWDDSTIIHEWAHFADDKWGCDDNPGGSHTVTSIVDARLAWGEGYPNFYQSVVRSALNQPRGESYIDLNGLGACGVCVNLETWHTTNPNSRSERNEMSIAASFWDLIDGANDGQDQVTIAKGYDWIEEVYLHPDFASAANRSCVFTRFLQVWRALNGPTDAGVAAAITQNTNLSNVFSTAVQSTAQTATDQPQIMVASDSADSYRWWERVVYIVDNSASMGGGRLDAVKTMLQEQADDLFTSAPKGVEFRLETFNNSTPINQQHFSGQFYPALFKPAIAGLTPINTPDSQCAVDAFGALQQGVAGSNDLNAWLFTDNFPSPATTPLETLNAELVARQINASFAVLQSLSICNPPVVQPEHVARQQQLQRQWDFRVGIAPPEPSDSIVPYLLTSLATGGQFLFVGEGQMESAADILRAQLKHTAGAGRWSDYVSIQPTYRHDRLASWEYQWIDAKEPNKGLYPGGVGSEGAVTVMRPTPILFYGQPVTMAHVFENGYITFGDAQNATADNQPLPNLSAPHGGLYPYWDELEWDAIELAVDQAGTDQNVIPVENKLGAVYAKQVGDWFVIEYDQFSSSTSLGFHETFEVLMNQKTGEIRFQYDNIDNNVGSATIGLESSLDLNPIDGVMVSHNTPNGAASDMGYRFLPAPPQPSKRYTVAVDSTMQSIGFLISGYHGTLAPIAVRTPDGSAVACNTSGVLCLNLGANGLVQYVQVDVNGRIGNWTVDVQPGDSGSASFSFSSMAAGALIMHSPTDRTLPAFEGNVVVIDLGQPVDGNQVTGEFRTPADTSFAQPFPLFDDGAHSDGQAGDGRFGSTPFRLGQLGSVYLWIDGKLNGQPFRRVEPKPFGFQPLWLSGPTSASSFAAKTVIPFTLANHDAYPHRFRINVQVPQGWRGQLEMAGDGTVQLGAGQSITIPVAVWMGMTDQGSLDQPSGASGMVNVAAVEVEQGALYDSATVEVTRRRPPAQIEIHNPNVWMVINSSAPLRFHVVDSQGYPVEDDTVLTLSSTLGTLPVTITTQMGSGEVIFAAGNQSGLAILRAETANGISATTTSTITLPIAERIVLSTTVNRLPADGKSTIQLTATVLDMMGTPQPNLPVRIGVEGGGDMPGGNDLGTIREIGGGSGSEVITGTTDAAGELRVTFTSGVQFGKVGLRAELVQDGVIVDVDRREIMLTAKETIYLPIIQR